MDAKNKEPLSLRLKAELERRGMSVPDFEAVTGIPKDRVYKWLKRGTDNIRHEDASIVEAWIVGHMDNSPIETADMDTKKPGPEGPDWKEFALEMKELASGWKDLASSQKSFIDQMQAISFNLNRLLLGVEAPLGEEASGRPAAADELLQTGRSGPFQISTQNVPAGSSKGKGR